MGVTAEVPWCASKKENLALALQELLVGELDVPLRAFQGCTPMCANTTTGLKPPWEESSGPVMIIHCNFLYLLYSFISFIFFSSSFLCIYLLYLFICFINNFYFFLLKATLKTLKKRLKQPMRLLH